MFTLPFDRKINSNPAAGKTIVIPKWTMSMTITPGIMHNYVDWEPGASHELFESQCLNLQVQFGDNVLCDQSVTGSPITFTQTFEDHPTPQWQQLVIKLSGRPEQVNVVQDRHPLLHVDIVIENLNVGLVLENLGEYLTDSGRKMGAQFMSENGQQVLPIYTPIYVWLLQQEPYITQFYKTKFDNFGQIES